VTREVRGAATLLVGHHLEVICLPELLESPYDAERPASIFAMENADHGRDHSVESALGHRSTATAEFDRFEAVSTVFQPQAAGTVPAGRIFSKYLHIGRRWRLGTMD
jgi:hypothetical protein